LSRSTRDFLTNLPLPPFLPYTISFPDSALGEQHKLREIRLLELGTPSEGTRELIPQSSRERSANEAFQRCAVVRLAMIKQAALEPELTDEVGLVREGVLKVLQRHVRKRDGLTEQLCVNIPRTHTPPLYRNCMVVRQVKEDLRETEEERRWCEVVGGFACVGELRDSLLL
jgi:hypothetical protein